MLRRPVRFTEAERSAALAMAGRPEALADTVTALGSGRLTLEEIGARAAIVIAHRTAAVEPPLDPPTVLRSLRARAAALAIVVERLLGDVAAALGEAGVPWTPFKGADLAARIYPDPSLRPMTDVDLLVHERDYRRARTALEGGGWRSVASGRRFERYVEEEGSAWIAGHPASPLPIELHLRLWGFVPEGSGDTLLDRAAPNRSLGPTGRRLRAADACLLSAVHPWLHLPPRRLSAWWEVRETLAAGGMSMVPEVRDAATELGLQLPVLLSALQVEALWGDARASALAGSLETSLRPPERAVLRRVRGRRADDVSIERLAVARLLSGRASRSGLLPVVRRFWAHPGIVERLTPEDWSWPRRRLVHVLQCAGVFPAPRADWWRAPTHGPRARR